MSETQQESDSQSQSIVDELNTQLPGSEPLRNLWAYQVGPREFKVFSARNGSLTVHTVDRIDLSCTCEDQRYNLEMGNREVCAHVCKALVDPDREWDPGMEISGQLLNETARLTDVIDRLERTATGREADAEVAENAPDSSESDSSGPQDRSDMDPVEKAQSWLRGMGVTQEEIDEMDFEINAQYKSLEIHPNNELPTAVFNELRDTLEENDDPNYGWWDERNYYFVVTTQGQEAIFE